MRSSFSISVLYHAYVYLEFLILACTIYILAPLKRLHEQEKKFLDWIQSIIINEGIVLFYLTILWKGLKNIN